MVEKGSWSCKPEDLFSPCNSNSTKEQKRPASDYTSMPDCCFKSSDIDSSSSELCSNDPILGDKCLVEDDSMSQYSINHKSQPDNELSFLDTDGWLDLDNFEDFDRMVLNYDSTFGTGSLDNEDEFCWLSLPYGTAGPDDDPLKSDFKFSSAGVSPLKSIPDCDMGLNDNIEGLEILDCDKKIPPFDKQLRSEMDVDLDAVPTSLSTFGESDTKSGITDDLMPQQKIQGQLLKQSAGKRKNSCLKDGDSDHPYAHMEQDANLKQPCGASSSGVTSQNSIHKQRSNMDSDSLGCVQIQTPPMHPDYSHTSNYTSLLPASSGSRSEHDGYPSPFKESSNASNTESFHSHPLETAALNENLYLRNDAKLMSSGFKSENMQNPMPVKSPGSAQKVGCQFENVNEGHSEGGEVSIGFSPETESSNMQESSAMSSAPDETSLEAANFRQLQQVLDQLDIRIKLCIRDSLYRLAKSADQRHIDVDASGLMGDDMEACKGVMTQDANRCTGFVNIETTTNPIDRSIAHLLFHRPSESSTLPLSDTLPLKSAPMIQGTGNNPPIFAEKQVCHEESSARVENKS
ncbi:protein LNK1 isoform X2 [Trifolium pratense]|uniref:protein LNK1 isoform X2 n=1 Tax=Trifolium pratense TaxID=57577 RepID=UPI001E691A0C|nr:protein LNK1 isoform X2 [Trifolium pratense]XP_045821505.1 protein LNK1 isoform X2 [Trifolium pratense]